MPNSQIARMLSGLALTIVALGACAPNASIPPAPSATVPVLVSPTRVATSTPENVVVNPPVGARETEAPPVGWQAPGAVGFVSAGGEMPNDPNYQVFEQALEQAGYGAAQGYEVRYVDNNSTGEGDGWVLGVRDRDGNILWARDKKTGLWSAEPVQYVKGADGVWRLSQDFEMVMLEGSAKAFIAFGGEGNGSTWLVGKTVEISGREVVAEYWDVITGEWQVPADLRRVMADRDPHTGLQRWVLYNEAAGAMVEVQAVAGANQEYVIAGGVVHVWQEAEGRYVGVGVEGVAGFEEKADGVVWAVNGRGEVLAVKLADGRMVGAAAVAAEKQLGVGVWRFEKRPFSADVLVITNESGEIGVISTGGGEFVTTSNMAERLNIPVVEGEQLIFSTEAYAFTLHGDKRGDVAFYDAENKQWLTLLSIFEQLKTLKKYNNGNIDIYGPVIREKDSALISGAVVVGKHTYPIPLLDGGGQEVATAERGAWVVWVSYDYVSVTTGISYLPREWGVGGQKVCYVVGASDPCYRMVDEFTGRTRVAIGPKKIDLRPFFTRGSVLQLVWDNHIPNGNEQNDPRLSAAMEAYNALFGPEPEGEVPRKVLLVGAVVTMDDLSQIPTPYVPGDYAIVLTEIR